jgi:YD repeat-containing protein
MMTAIMRLVNTGKRLVKSTKTCSAGVAVLFALTCGQLLCAQSQPVQYFYDDLGRLVTVVSSDGTTVITYAYDAVGNILYVNRSTLTQKGALAIYSFTPQQGPVTTPVTIYGKGFNADPAQDVVKFNGVAASVTSATISTLLTSVPLGATTGPISVTVGTNSVTSTQSFVVTQAPVLFLGFPKSALFNVVIPNVVVTGAGLTGATFSFNPAGPTVSNVTINSTGTSATMTISCGNAPGTYALVATTSSGNSGLGAVPANRFTVVDPASPSDTDGDTWPDSVEATYGTDPLDPNSHPTSVTMPTLQGEQDSLPPSVLNLAPPPGSQEATIEVDAIFFSVCNSDQPPCPTHRRGELIPSSLSPSEGENVISGSPDALVTSGSTIADANSVDSPEAKSAKNSGQNKEGGDRASQRAAPK